MWIKVFFLAIVQGLAEMLPVSSSAHVIFAEKLMGLDPSAPELTFLLVMLHTGTMFAALAYFGRRWLALLRPAAVGPTQRSVAAQAENRQWDKARFLKLVVLATAVTGTVGLLLKKLIEKIVLEHLLGYGKGEVEMLFNNLPLIGGALLAAGILILVASRTEEQARKQTLSARQSVLIGLVQGLCLPFRGFSRSGATISTGLYQGVSRRLSEEFSFALAVALTPAVVLLELKRLLGATSERALASGGTGFSIASQLAPGLVGMALSFVAGLVALRWLSSWLESGRWRFFGYYCVVFSGVIFGAFALGF
jgi:undecaprenyl-diphosphatase